MVSRFDAADGTRLATTERELHNDDNGHFGPFGTFTDGVFTRPRF